MTDLAIPSECHTLDSAITPPRAAHRSLVRYLDRRYLLWLTRPRKVGVPARIRLLVGSAMAVGLLLSSTFALYAPAATGSGNYGNIDDAAAPEKKGPDPVIRRPAPAVEEEEYNPQPARRRAVVPRSQVTVVVVEQAPAPAPILPPAPTGIDITIVGGSHDQPARLVREPGIGKVTILGGQAKD